MASALLPRARLLAGLLLAGQGILFVTRVLDHEAPLALGWAALLLGLALVAWGRVPLFRSPPRRRGEHGGFTEDPPVVSSSPRALRALRASAVGRGRAWLVAAIGIVAAGGVVAYNVARGSTLSLPEAAILAYGVALVAASPFLSRRALGTDVGTLVAFSFPLLLAPLSLYAVNAALASRMAQTPVAWYVQSTLVAPMAAALRLVGLDALTSGDTVRLVTPRGPLFLSVGVVCAGLYASVLFLGVFALFAWERRTPPARLAAYLAVGLLGLHAANVLRLVLLAVVGYEWGPAALQSFHQHAGWVLFLLWSVAFWAVVLRRFEGPVAPA